MLRHLRVTRGLRRASRRSISFSAAAVPGVLRSYVNGGYASAGEGAARLAVVDPATGARISDLEVADAALVDEAVDGAARAQREWAAMSGMERGRLLRRLGELLRAHNDEIAALETRDTGRPIAETRITDVVSASDAIDFYAGIAPTISGRHVDLGASSSGSFGYTRCEPLGVCAGIGAWNYPVQGAAWKFGPCAAAGNAMVFKPAEATSLGALAMAELCDAAGLPSGLFQVVLGAGPTGELLTRHGRVAKVSFTGEVDTGKAITRDAAGTLKKTTMELGGKSPLIVFDDADVENAAAAAMMANWFSNGQVCSNGTRVFVQRGIRERFLARLLERSRALRIGDPFQEDTDIGPLIHEEHLRVVRSFVQRGVDEGCRVLLGTTERHVPAEERLRGGAYFAPVVFGGCEDHHTVVREEIFGPVMAVLDFDSEEEVVRRANDTIYGLGAGVFTSDLATAHRVVAQLEAGTTWINNYNLAPVELPFGGHKQSGIGRENGVEGLQQWMQVKSVYVEMGDVWCPYP